MIHQVLRGAPPILVSTVRRRDRSGSPAQHVAPDSIWAFSHIADGHIRHLKMQHSSCTVPLSLKTQSAFCSSAAKFKEAKRVEPSDLLARQLKALHPLASARVGAAYHRHFVFALEFKRTKQGAQTIQHDVFLAVAGHQVAFR